MHKTLAQFILNSIFGCWWENRVKHNLSNEPQKMEHVVSEFFLFYVSEPNDKAHKFITRWTSWWLGITKQSLTCSFKNLCGRMLHSICLLSNHHSNNNVCFFSRMSHLHLEFNLFIGLIRLNFILQFSAQLHIPWIIFSWFLSLMQYLFCLSFGLNYVCRHRAFTCAKFFKRERKKETRNGTRSQFCNHPEI